MLNVMEQYICDLIINVLKKSNTSLTFNEIKEQLTCKIDEFENIEYKADVLYPKNSGSICLQDNSLIIDVSKKSAVLIKLTKIL